MRQIEQQVIVITGASSGIGLVTAQQAARRGAKVVLAARNGRDLEHAVDEIRREGGDAIAVPTDVSDFGEVQRLAERALEHYGRIDSWVNNAGVALYGEFTQLDLDDFRRVLEINFFGQVHGAKAALPHLENSSGALICIGSALSDRGAPLQSAYSAAKHAVKGWLDALRVELEHAGSSVRVTLIKPASINTPLFSKAKTLLGVEPQPIPPVYPPEIVADAILQAAAGDYRELYTGTAGRMLALGETLSPRMVDHRLARGGYKKQKSSWSRPAEAPANLYAPVRSDGGVRGDFSGIEKNWSAYDVTVRKRGRRVAGALLALAALTAAAAAVRAGRRKGAE